MAVYPHIRPISPSTAIQGKFALEGKPLPGELYYCWLQAESLDLNQQFWLQKVTGGDLFKAKVQGTKPLHYPATIANAALAIDSERTHQEYRLYVGTTALTATAVEQDETSNRRFQILLSVG